MRYSVSGGSVCLLLHSRPVTSTGTPSSGSVSAPAAADAKFFWHGILWLNDLGEHAFFDIRSRHSVDMSTASVFSTDVPPLLVRAEDSLHVMFLLENSTGLQIIRHKVGEAVLAGSAVRSWGGSVLSSQRLFR